MVITLRANLQVALKFGPIEYGIAGLAFGPQAFRYRAAIAAVGLDSRGKYFFKPAHFVAYSS